MLLCLDVENTTTKKAYVDHKGKTSVVRNMLPFVPENRLVSIGVSWHGPKKIKTDYFCFHHNSQKTTPKADTKVQEYLDKTTLLIGHNLKHDILWLRACGFTYSGKLWDTQIAEYVLQRGIKKSLKLKSLSEEHNLTRKKSDLVEEYFESGVLCDAIPWETLEEYGRGDTITTLELYDHQMERLSEPENQGLLPTIEMMCAFLYCIIEMQHNGLKVDRKALIKLKEETIEERTTLERELQHMVQEVMGDTPINLQSADDRSKVLFSRTLPDKSVWASVFNIGNDASGKKLRRPHLSPSKFNKLIRSLTTVVRKTQVKHCHTCEGTGRIMKLTKEGKPYKILPKCVECSGKGIIYVNTGQTAGFKLVPRGVRDVASAGFNTDKNTLAALAETAQPKAIEFMNKLSRYNALGTYLSTYTEGTEKHLVYDDMLHINLNQTVTATGRLSSSAPNYQNQVQGWRYPIRKVVISRFPGGSIMEPDYGQLEFRVAGLLSECPVVRSDLDEGVDVHVVTRDTINTFDVSLPQITRNDAKSDTFKPLYGGQSGTPRQQHYYESFLKKYHGVAEWHERLKTEALTNKIIRTPGGREYAFPNVKRLPNGYVLYTTNIVNYPVQGFATGDLVPLGILATYRLMQEAKVKSLMFLTVHDSVEFDIYPGEEEMMHELVCEGLLQLPEMCQEFYGWTFEYPMVVENKMGPNWMEMETIGEVKR